MRGIGRVKTREIRNVECVKKINKGLKLDGFTERERERKRERERERERERKKNKYLDLH